MLVDPKLRLACGFHPIPIFRRAEIWRQEFDMASSPATVVDAHGADADLEGWFSSALSVLTTVGKIAGTLSGSDFVDLGPLGRGTEPTLGSVVFFRDADGSIKVQNQDVQYPVCLDFPGDLTDGVQPQTLTLGAASTFNISPAFTSASEADVDAFGITPCGEDAGGRGTGSEATVRASATNVQSGLTVTLGSYLTAQITASDRTVAIGAVAGFTLAAVVLLNIRGAGQTAVKLINAVRRAPDGKGDGEPFVFTLPAGIDVESANGLGYVEVVATVSAPDGAAPIVGEPMTDEDRARLAGFAASR
jgi:hypothetical protein